MRQNWIPDDIIDELDEMFELWKNGEKGGKGTEPAERNRQVPRVQSFREIEKLLQTLRDFLDKSMVDGSPAEVSEMIRRDVEKLEGMLERRRKASQENRTVQELERILVLLRNAGGLNPEIEKAFQEQIRRAKQTFR